MYTVLLSGGSGKRLWPLSNDLRSKQYIRLLTHEDSDKQCSMVQRVWAQLRTSGLKDNIICASPSQTEILTSQLGDINIAVEPFRRDTFAAVVLSCAYLKSKMNASEDEIAAVIPVDPFCEKKYFETVASLPNVLEKTNANIALMGVRATSPSQKFGYIIPENANAEYCTVRGFCEKPSAELATQLIQEGAMWNCGVFCFRIQYVLNIAAAFLSDTSYDTVCEQYDRLPQNSFDREVLEKTKNIAVKSYNGIWKDLGTWQALTSEMKTECVGAAFTDGECENVRVINELDVPIIIMGTKNIVVAASFDGILVADMQRSEHLKEMLSQVNLAPRYEERRWGTVKVIDVTQSHGELRSTRKIKVYEGMNSSYHYHKNRTEAWTILSGTGELYMEGMLLTLNEGVTVTIPKGKKHAVRAYTDLEFIEIHIGGTTGDNDINRITFDYDKAKEREL